MSKKTIFLVLAALFVLTAQISLIVGHGWCHKAPSGGGWDARGEFLGEREKISSVAANAKAHALAVGLGRVPIYFVPNRGQADNRVDFYIQGDDKTVYFSPDGLTLTMRDPARTGSSGGPKRWTVKLDFLDARKDVKPQGLEETGAAISYFRGKPEEWKSGLPAYSKIVYRDLWPGIDLVYKGGLDRLKYEFIVHPGADPSKIRLAYRGAEDVGLTEAGRLSVKTPAGVFEDEIPVAYQELNGKRAGVSVSYSLEDIAEGQISGIVPGSGITPIERFDNHRHVYGFVVSEYDRSRTLVIDPAVLVYCGYVGGVNSDQSKAIAVDDSGNIYITGHTYSDGTSFPVIVGPDLTRNGVFDSFVAKVNASGTGLVYCGYIGSGGSYDFSDIAVDESGNAYITGKTDAGAATFPVTVGPDLTHNGGLDAFVAKINPSGTGLVYCGYIGGSNQDIGMGIAIDDAGNAYVSGNTSSTQTTFPVKIGPDLTHNGGEDAWVAKVNAAGTGLMYCGYIGGSGDEVGNGIAIDSSGNAYVTGQTSSSQATFPVIVGPDLTAQGGVYVAKVNPSGSGLVYCGYIGEDSAWSKIAVDSAGNAYVAGSTYATEATFPVTVGPDVTHNGDMDVFVAKVNTSGTGFVYCGYIGGSGRDELNDIVIDSFNNAYIAGFTHSGESTFPVVDGPDLTLNGGRDGFVAEVNSSGSALVYCGYIGGTDEDICYGIAVDGSGNAYVTGMTSSNQASFPVAIGPDLTYNGGGDAFVAKVGTIPGPPITSLLPDSANAGDPGFVLSVIGSEFVDGAVVRWDGSERTTTYISNAELQAQITAADLAAGKTVQVTVRNPNGGVSNALPFTISNPEPTLSSLSTTSVTGGSAAFTLTVQGSNFVPNSIVRWNGNDRATTYVNGTELQAAITTTDLATGGSAQVTVFNPAPAGGTSGALAVDVSSFTLSSSPSRVTITAGQSATYTVTLTPQFGSFDAAVTFSCAGLPSKCTASFSPTSATPGAAAVTTTLTLTTTATSRASGTTGVALFGTTGYRPPTLGLFALVLALLTGNVFCLRLQRRVSSRWLAACAIICLVIVIGSCSAGGGDDMYNGTPKGTHTISVQGTSGNMTVPSSITLVVN